MITRQRTWLEIGGILVAVLLPLTFNPFSTEPFESSKVILFQGITLAMVLALILPALITIFQQNGGQGGVEKLIPQSASLNRWREMNPLTLPVITYALVYMSATAVSININISLWGSENKHGTVTILIVILFFFLLTYALENWLQVQRIITAGILSSIPVAFYGWIQYLGLDALPWITLSISPIHSTLGRSVFLGGYLAMVIPLTLGRLLDRIAGRQKRLSAGIIIILFLQTSCLILTLSRGAWLGFIGGLFLFLILLINKKSAWMLFSVIFLLVGLGLFAFVGRGGWLIISNPTQTPPEERFAQIRSFSDKSRLAAWDEAIQLIPGRWILGYGPETYTRAIEEQKIVRSTSIPSALYQDDPHNIFLYHLTAVGVAGFLAFLWILVRYYLLLVRIIRYETSGNRKTTIAAVMSSTSAYLIQAQFNPDVITLMVFFWITLSLGVAIIHLDKVKRAAAYKT